MFTAAPLGSSAPNKWRLIIDLSAPDNHSVNDGILKELASLSYMSIDDVVAVVLKMGRGTMLKMDIKQAFRNVPVHPSDRGLLGMQWEGRIYVNKVLPFGVEVSSITVFSTSRRTGLDHVQKRCRVAHRCPEIP